MRTPLALAFATILFTGIACAEDQPAAPARDPAPGTQNQAVPQSGSSEPSAPATQESQGVRLDEGSGNAPKAQGTGPGEDCTNAGAAASASGSNATVDCGPGQNRTQRR